VRTLRDKIQQIVVPAARFPGDGSRASRASSALSYVGRRRGYWRPAQDRISNAEAKRLLSTSSSRALRLNRNAAKIVEGTRSAVRPLLHPLSLRRREATLFFLELGSRFCIQALHARSRSRYTVP
jgi:antirestriction protein ArdC